MPRSRLAVSAAEHRVGRVAVALLVGLVGVLVALVLPFAPVITQETTVVWPVPGRPVVSSTAMFVPYRPAELTSTVPCSALRSAAERDHVVTVLATGPPGEGMVLRTAAGAVQLLLGRRMVSSTPLSSIRSDCWMRLHSGSAGMMVTLGTISMINLAGEPVPQVFAFHTDLQPWQAAGMTVTVRTASPFATSPTGLKILLVAGQLLAALVALGLLGGWWFLKAGQPQWRTLWVDLGVIGILLGWAVIGPLTDDDGFATTIARNAALTGNVGNYYRWWNASETPFALSEQLLAPLTQISLAPLWLRLPSTVLGIATWFVLSRGVLGAAVPAAAGTARIRLLAGVFLLAAWLPFNLGVRPEPYVAFGVTAVLALLWRARGLAPLGWAALVAGLTIPISPGGILVAAPIVVFAPRIIAIIGSGAHGWVEVLAHVLLLACIGGVGLTAIFTDQTWQGVVTATRWHAFFGPSLSWYQEPLRYRFLLGTDQDGNAAKRIPVVLTLALLPVVGALLVRRTEPGDADRGAGRLCAVVVVALALLWLTPSKWSHHFGALAGLFASFLVVAVVLISRRARAPITDRVSWILGAVGAALVAGAAGLAFAGPNAWWQPAVYDVPWATGPVRPIGLTLDSPLLWMTGALALVVLRPGDASYRHSRATAAPAVLAVAAGGTAVAVLLGSFLAAPVRRPAGSLALMNLHQLAGRPSCGLADDIQVLSDGPVLAPADLSGGAHGFTALAGFDPSTPPPERPGSGMSMELWGSRTGGPQSTGRLTSPWFRLPQLSPAAGIAVSVSGRTDKGNMLVLEFGRARLPGVTVLGQRTPFDQVLPDPNHPDGPPDYRPWRSIGLDATQIPAGADRVRIQAVDATTDPDGWLAVTGPRLRSGAGLSTFVASHGPVLVNWPQAFLFPCVHNIVEVADGLAGAPCAIIEAPRRYGPLSAVITDQAMGGDFAALSSYGHLYQVPTRLTGHPEIDWGALQLSTDPAAHDAYLSGHGDISGSNRADTPDMSPCRGRRVGGG